jgi:peptidoglycan-associated lipoprotein
MKINQSLVARTAFAAFIAIVSLLGACSSTKLDDEPSAKIEPRTGIAGTGSSSSASTNSDTAANPNANANSTVTTVTANDPLKDPASPLAKRSVYFDYDSFVLKDEYRATVEAHARYLNAVKTRKVVVQGNTDERGSREYNLALGQKRAEVVRKSLMALGVSDSQIEAVSFGEEKPKATGSDEAAFAENRRADLAY